MSWRPHYTCTTLIRRRRRGYEGTRTMAKKRKSQGQGGKSTARGQEAFSRAKSKTHRFTAATPYRAKKLIDTALAEGQPQNAVDPEPRGGGARTSPSGGRPPRRRGLPARPCRRGSRRRWRLGAGRTRRRCMTTRAILMLSGRSGMRRRGGLGAVCRARPGRRHRRDPTNDAGTQAQSPGFGWKAPPLTAEDS